MGYQHKFRLYQHFLCLYQHFYDFIDNFKDPLALRPVGSKFRGQPPAYTEETIKGTMQLFVHYSLDSSKIFVVKGKRKDLVG